LAVSIRSVFVANVQYLYVTKVVKIYITTFQDGIARCRSVLFCEVCPEKVLLLSIAKKNVDQKYRNMTCTCCSFVNLNSENCIKLSWFLMKLQTKLSWLLFYGPQCISNLL